MRSQWIAALMALMAMTISQRALATTLSEELSPVASSGVEQIVEERLVEERIYDGMLPTEEHKLVMPAVRDERGRVQCVQLLKALMGAPLTDRWQEGRKLKTNWSEVKVGTAIATFKGGRYPKRHKGHGNKHAAIFLRASDTGIYVFDQFAGTRVATERFIPWHNPRNRRPSNNAASYSTVRW